MGALGLAAFAILVLSILVTWDRLDARKRQGRALALGVAATSLGETILAVSPSSHTQIAAAAAPGGPTLDPLAVKGVAGPIAVGAAVTLSSWRGGANVPANWALAATDVVELQAAGAPPHQSVKIRGVKEGVAHLVVGDMQGTDQATVAITVEPAKTQETATSPIVFRLLGSGIGAGIIALVSLGLVGGLAFIGDLDIATISALLGVGVGTGAAIAANRSGDSAAGDK